MIISNTMVTRRSLNKLERKAHRSIHDAVEVTDEDKAAKSFTRDRFDKKQAVEKQDEPSK